MDLSLLGGMESWEYSSGLNNELSSGVKKVLPNGSNAFVALKKMDLLSLGEILITGEIVAVSVMS